MARNQKDEIQQNNKRDVQQASALAEVMSKTKQYVADLTNKIYDLSLYTGIKLVRTAKRVRKLYLIRYNKCKTQVYEKVTNTTQSARALAVQKLNRRWDPLKGLSERFKAGIQNLHSAKEQGTAQFLKLCREYCFSAMRSGLKFSVRAMNYVAPIVAIGILIYTVSATVNTKYVLAVEYDGEQIGYIENELVFEDAYRSMNDRIIDRDNSEQFGKTPVYTLAVKNENTATLAVDPLCDTLIQHSGSEITTASGLYVDGALVGAVMESAELTQSLQSILDQYKTGADNETVSFVRDVKVKQGLYSVASIVPIGDIQSLIHSQVSVSETASEPYLSVKVTRKERWNFEIGFDSIKEETDDLYVGNEKVGTEGENGEAIAIGEVTYLNGQEISRVHEETEMVKEPTTKVVLVGTKEKPTYTSRNDYTGSVSSLGSGRFIWPVAGGYVSCGFGGYAGHAGMDIAASYGTTVYAADAGTVITATNYGWNYGYGNYVVIDHGNGVRTLYAHNSSVYVYPGQVVSRGQAIAGIGQTGNASGNHCHFEIIINGYKVNPAGYIGYGN